MGTFPPIGVVCAATIIAIVGVLAGLALLKAQAGTHGWAAYLLPLVLLSEAAGLLLQMRWSWWVLQVMMLNALGLNLWRFYHHRDTWRAFLRIPIVALWMWYFLFPSVRAWFSVP